MYLAKDIALEKLGDKGLCPICLKQPITQAYCRDCDDFLDEGHAYKCKWKGEQHPGHRIQRRGDDPTSFEFLTMRN